MICHVRVGCTCFGQFISFRGVFSLFTGRAWMRGARIAVGLNPAELK